MDNEIQEAFLKLKSDFALQIDKTARDYSDALGRAVRQRFDLLEAMIGILAANAPQAVQMQITQEISKHRASWSK
jgi:hypothetical protein